MIQSELAVVAGDGEESHGGETLIERVGEGVADPGQVRLAGAIVEGKNEDDVAVGVGGFGVRSGLGKSWKSAEKQKRRPLFQQPAKWLGPDHSYEYRG